MSQRMREITALVWGVVLILFFLWPVISDWLIQATLNSACGG